MRVLLDRDPELGELQAFHAAMEAKGFLGQQVVHTIRASPEVVHAELAQAISFHLYEIHRSRVQLMATALPPARKILDLGGANSPLCDSGYPHAFDELTIIDLPPEDRHDEFANRVVTERVSERGAVRVAYTSMTDLSLFDDSSIDLVWSGQSIEHITLEQAQEVYREVHRVLSPEGWFCLDTPNRHVTAIHADGAMIHPDHQHEYTPEELVAHLDRAGFDVVRSLGVCDMALTVASGRIDYRDFVIGAGITTSVATAYIQFHACRPRK